MVVFSLPQCVKKAQITSVAHICIHVNSFAVSEEAHIYLLTRGLCPVSQFTV